MAGPHRSSYAAEHREDHTEYTKTRLPGPEDRHVLRNHTKMVRVSHLEGLVTHANVVESVVVGDGESPTRYVLPTGRGSTPFGLPVRPRRRRPTGG